MLKLLFIFLLLLLQVHCRLEKLYSSDGVSGVGGTGGSAFDYTGSSQIKRVRAWTSVTTQVNFVEFEWINGSIAGIGERGELPELEYKTEIKFDPEELVVGPIQVCVKDNIVGAIVFSTSSGKVFSTWNAKSMTDCRLLIPSIASYKLVSVFGRSGQAVDQIGFYADVSNFWKPEEKLEIVTSSAHQGEFGGDGGKVFTVEDASGVKEIKAWFRESLESLQIEWFSGRKATFGKIPDPDVFFPVKMSKITFRQGESIQNPIQVCKKDYVSCIKFTTTCGNSFSACSDNNAECIELSASTPSFILTGLFGGSGDSIDRIGFFHRVKDPVKRIDMELVILSSKEGVSTVGRPSVRGNQFDFEDYSGMKQIKVWYRDWITAMSVDWFSERSFVFGNDSVVHATSDAYTVVNLAQDELIQGPIKVCNDSQHVVCLEFRTDKGKHFRTPCSGTPACYELSSSSSQYALTGFFGSSSDCIDSIGLYSRALSCARPVEKVQAPISSDGSITIGNGTEGNAFEYQDASGIKAITVWYRDWIDTMQIDWFSGESVEIGKPKDLVNDTDAAAAVVLGSHETLKNSIRVCELSGAKAYVSCIEFKTSSGKVFSSCGNDRGTCRDLALTPDSYFLTGVFGNGGVSGVSQLGFYAMPAPERRPVMTK